MDIPDDSDRRPHLLDVVLECQHLPDLRAYDLDAALVEQLAFRRQLQVLVHIECVLVGGRRSVSIKDGAHF